MLKAFIDNFVKPAGAATDAKWRQCIEIPDYPEKHFCRNCGRQSRWYAEPHSWDARSGERTYWIKTVCSCLGFQYHFISIGLPNKIASTIISPHISQNRKKERDGIPVTKNIVCKYCNQEIETQRFCPHCGGPQG